MTGGRVTSHEVAQAAGVSRSTVSIVLSGKRGARISATTRERVERAARKLGYTPDAAGRALATRRTMNIGLVYSAAQAGHGFLLDVMWGLTRVTARHDLRLLVDTFQEDAAYQSLQRLTRAKHIDGLVMFEPRGDDPDVRQLVEDGFPLVFIGSSPSRKVCSVDVDNRAAARVAVRHLLDGGRRRVACVTNAPMAFTAAAARYQGYLDALRLRRIAPDPALFHEGNYTARSGFEAMEEILRGASLPPDAVFVASDTVAFGAMRAIRERNLRIPEDIAVVGFDDIPLAGEAFPPLSSVSFSGEEEGRRAAEMLIRLIAGGIAPGRREHVRAELVVRGSSDAEAS